MSNELTATDQFVRRELEKFGVDYDEQTSSIPEIKKALKGASKQGGSGVGRPEFLFLSGDNLIVIEDKFDNNKLELLDKNGNLDLSINGIANYGVNGAVHYGKHIVEKTNSFKEIIAIGISGNKENHNIQPYFLNFDDDVIHIEKLPKLNDLGKLHPDNIDEWYSVNILKNISAEEKRIIELKKVASDLHEDLRIYASLEGENKATVVSAILLALNEKSFNIKTLNGDDLDGAKDGDKIYGAVKNFLNRDGVMPLSKIDVVLNKFSFIKTNISLNKIHKTLQMTPIKYYVNKLYNEVFHHLKSNTDFDILGNFYGEFVKYGGSDGNSLGIVLTPRHITTLMSELIDIHPDDYVLDPACGSGAFLISAMNRMVELSGNDLKKKEKIKQNQLLGIELQEKMFTVATTNMILRGDGKSNLQLADMFTIKGQEFQEKFVNKVLFNPPYSQGKKNPALSEINFIYQALSMSIVGGKLAVIVPQSTMAQGNNQKKLYKIYKSKILKSNTLEMVITCNKNTFYGIGTNTAIAVFTTGIPHPKKKQVKFINFEEDGMVVRKHIGLVDDGTYHEKKEYLLDVINGNIDSKNENNPNGYTNNFMVKSTITSEDEWLHSFFYFNEEIPGEIDFENTIADYLTFQFDMYIHGRDYLFKEEEND